MDFLIKNVQFVNFWIHNSFNTYHFPTLIFWKHNLKYIIIIEIFESETSNDISFLESQKIHVASCWYVWASNN